MQTPPRCVNCSHFNTDHTGAICMHEKGNRIDPVYGEKYNASCFLMRTPGFECGPEGKLYSEN